MASIQASYTKHHRKKSTIQIDIRKTYPLMDKYNHQKTYPSMDKYNHQKTYPLMDKYNHQKTYPSMDKYNHQKTYPSMDKYNHQKTYPSMDKYNHQKTYPSGSCAISTLVGPFHRKCPLECSLGRPRLSFSSPSYLPLPHHFIFI